MADNIDEEPLESLANTQSQNPSDKIIPIEEIETISQTQEIKNMEVHHHTHPHGKKNWKSYFWEFLMLFLAVFCGFLAEYQLEHVIEHQREREYMNSFINDLQSDTLDCNKTNKLAIQQKDVIDSIINLVNNEPLTGKNISKLYMLHYSSGRIIHATFENRTATQLKNSGNMRLIRNSIVADSIRDYWSRQDVADRISERLENTGIEIRELASSIFHNKYLFANKQLFSPPDSIRSDVQFIEAKPELFAEYSNKQYSKARTIMVYQVNIDLLNAKAVRLIDLIRKEYNLK